MQNAPCTSTLRTFFTLGYLLILAFLFRFFTHVSIEGWQAWLFLVVATLVYGAMYLLPVALLVFGVDYLLPGKAAHTTWRRRSVAIAAIAGLSAVLLLIFTDYQIFLLYDYHINGFVLNLVTTPGGIESLGITPATIRTALLQSAQLVAGVGILFWFSARLPSLGLWVSRWFMNRYALAVLLLIFGTQEVMLAYVKRVGLEQVMAAAQATPFRFDTSMSTLFRSLKIEKGASNELRLTGGTPAYPAVPIELDTQAETPNIIMLVAESFRWDLLDPEITPNLWKFSQRASRYEHHYTGGNRTRMGLFSLFYGLYAPYWGSFERTRTAPVLMDVLRARNYQFALHTSQSFDYPELRHTTFAKVPESDMQELKQGEPWRRDQQNITDLIGKLQKRDATRPFFGFMFFESTHAPYDFPRDDVVRKDYLDEMNYAEMNLGSNIEGIHARYINAAHHIDREVARLLDHLQKTGMLKNTIVLFTGDHGEEFMEKGHWGHGHGSTFPEEQVRVPFILSVPGQRPAVIKRETSHLQFAPTMMKLLGVRNPARDFSSADTLDTSLPYFVLGEYDFMGVKGGEYKISFPYTGSSYFRYTVQDRNDGIVSRDMAKSVVADYRQTLDAIVAESRRFVTASPGKMPR